MRRTNEDEEEIEVREAKRGTLVRFFLPLRCFGHSLWAPFLPDNFLMFLGLLMYKAEWVLGAQGC